MATNKKAVKKPVAKKPAPAKKPAGRRDRHVMHAAILKAEISFFMLFDSVLVEWLYGGVKWLLYADIKLGILKVCSDIGISQAGFTNLSLRT